MGRKAYFNNEQFIEAALELICLHGPEAVTVASIAKLVDAPIGSVYHRFSSRDLIIAELWLGIVETFQAGFIELLKRRDVVNAAIYTPQWVRERPRESKVLLLYRREELMTSQWPSQFNERAQKLGKQLSEAITEFVLDLFGNTTPESIERVIFSLIEAPLALVKPYLVRGEVPPAHVDILIRETCECILGRVL